jgi:hypothetical protein
MSCCRAVQRSALVKVKTSSATFVSDELGRCPAVPVLPCGFSLPSLPFFSRCSVCSGTTRVVAKRLEWAWARHGVELYIPCSPMARRTVRWQSEGMEGRDATLAGARAIRRGVIRIGDAKIKFHIRLAVSGGVKRFRDHGGISFTRAVRAWRAQATGVRDRGCGLARTASRGGKGNRGNPSLVQGVTLSPLCLCSHSKQGNRTGRRKGMKAGPARQRVRAAGSSCR